jgi:hypothetical protein
MISSVQQINLSHVSHCGSSKLEFGDGIPQEKFGKTLLIRLNQVEGTGKFAKPDLSAQEPMGTF